MIATLRRYPRTMLAGLFVTSRIILYFMGLRFDASPLDRFWQIFDPELLRHDLLRTLLYCHAQPPLFNLFIGLVLKTFGQVSPAAFAIIFHAGGLAGTLLIYSILRRLRAGAAISFAAAVVYLLNPGTILLEQFLFYEFLIALLLIGTTYALVRFAESSAAGWCALFFASLATLALLRASFHLAWMLLVAGGMTWLMVGRAKQIGVCAAIAIVPVAGWYAKNFAFFGQVSPSTWLGMNFSGIALRELDPAARRSLAEQGILSPVSTLLSFQPPEAYEALDPTLRNLPLTRRYADVPALALRRFSTGVVNFNNPLYIEVSRRYLHDSTAMIRHDPARYAESLVHSFSLYFHPVEDWGFVEANRARLGIYCAAYDLPVLGRLPLGNSSIARVAWFRVAASVAGVVLGAHRFRQLSARARAGGLPDATAPERAVLFFILLTTIEYGLLVNLIEYGENNRFRYAIDPLDLILVTLLFPALAAPFRRLLRDRIPAACARSGKVHAVQ